MQTERQFTAPMSAAEAVQRAQYVLGKWRYKFWSIPGGARFERSLPLAGLMVVHPHHVHARIDVKVRDNEDGTCQVFIQQQVFKFGQPSTNLDKMVWQGDMEDLEGSLLRRQEPKIDRVRQNAYAGSISVKYMLLVVLPPLFIAGWLAIAARPLGAVILLVVVIFSAIVLPHLPFKMPHFPLENQVPTPPFESNYPRGRQSS